MPAPTAAPSGPSPPSPGSSAATRPAGVTVNAMSPIAATRMMASALERARKAGQSGGGGHLLPVRRRARGPGSVRRPSRRRGVRLVLGSGALRRRSGGGRRRRAPARRGRADRRRHLAGRACSTRSSPRAFAKAEATQASAGGSNPRFGPIFDEDVGSGHDPAPAARSCVVVSDRPGLTASLVGRARGTVRPLPAGATRSAASTRPRPPCGPTSEADGPVDAVVVASAGDGARRPDGRRVGAGAGRAPRHRGGHPHRCRVGPGRRRLRRRRRPPPPAGDPDRRHHDRGPQPGPGRGAARPRRPQRHRGTGHRLRRRTRGARGRGRAHGGRTGGPPARPPRGGRAGRSRAGGRRRMAGTAQPPPTDRQRHLRRARRSPTGSTTRSARSSAPPTPRPTEVR